MARRADKPVVFDKDDPLHMMLLDLVLDPPAREPQHTFAAKIRWRLVNEARDLIVNAKGGVPRHILNENSGQLADLIRDSRAAAKGRAS